MAAWIETCLDGRIREVVNKEQECDNESGVKQLEYDEVCQRDVTEQQG